MDAEANSETRIDRHRRSFPTHLFTDTLYTSVARSKVGDWLDVALLGGAAARSRHRHRRIQPDSHADAARNDLPAPARIRGPANHVVPRQSHGIDSRAARFARFAQNERELFVSPP